MAEKCTAQYYEANAPSLPCGFTGYQGMEIYCNIDGSYLGLYNPPHNVLTALIDYNSDFVNYVQDCRLEFDSSTPACATINF